MLVTLMGLKSSYGRAADGGSQGRLFILDLARCTRSFNVDAFGGDCPTGRVVR